MSIVFKEFVFEKSHTRRERSYFWLSIIFLVFGCYALYSGLTDFVRSYQPERSPDYTFFQRLFDNFENRLLLFLIFIVTAILFLRSLYVKNRSGHYHAKNYIQINKVGTKESVEILSIVTRTKTVFKKETVKEDEECKFLFNLNEVEDFIHVKDPQNEKARKLKLDVKRFNRSGGSSGGSKFSMGGNLSDPALGNANLISLESNSIGGNTSAMKSLSVNGPTIYNPKYEPRVHNYNDFIIVFLKGQEDPKYIGSTVEPLIDLLVERYPDVELE